MVALGTVVNRDLYEDFEAEADPMLEADIPAGEAEGVLEEDEV